MKGQTIEVVAEIAMTGPYRIGFSRHWTSNGVLIRSIGSLLIITVNASDTIQDGGFPARKE